MGEARVVKAFTVYPGGSDDVDVLSVTFKCSCGLMQRHDYITPDESPLCPQCGAPWMLAITRRPAGKAWENARQEALRLYKCLLRLGRRGKWETALRLRRRSPCSFCLVQQMLSPSPSTWVQDRGSPTQCPDCPARSLCATAPDLVPLKVLERYLTAEEGVLKLRAAVNGLARLQVPGREEECDRQGSNDSITRS